LGIIFIRFALDLSGVVVELTQIQAPGEAEAELAQLNRLGFIDAVISEDSDTIVFGAPCVIRTSGFVPSSPFLLFLVIDVIWV
jgi:5'-3' exonuclease